MEPKFLATAVGSMPFDDPDYAVQKSLKCMPDAPIWPQMSRLGVTEQMEAMYCEGMPCAIVDYEKEKMYFDTSVDYSELFAEFYEAYIDAFEGSGDFSPLAITEKHAHGLYALERALKAEGKKRPYVKVHTTGPCSFALSICDENKRATYYNEEFKDVIVKALAMKCRWQIQKFRPYAEENIICFVDEPVFAGFGSSTYVSVSRDDVVATLGEVIEAVHIEKALAGVHCCGNTEWSILVDANADIINFDAFEFGESICIYPKHIKDHLENKGGVLAWGIVPTSRHVHDETLDSLETMLEKRMDDLVAATGIDKALITRQAILTPACGTGSLQIKDAEVVFDYLDGLSKRMKAKYGY
jgi:hypothetical protein